MSSEEEMSQIIRTNEIYKEVIKIISGISTNGVSIVCVTLHYVSSIFNLNIHLLFVQRFFVLKFLFIEIIHSNYLIVIQKAPALFANVLQHTNE